MDKAMTNGCGTGKGMAIFSPENRQLFEVLGRIANELPYAPPLELDEERVAVGVGPPLLKDGNEQLI
jgi:hypothetical protein